MVNSIEAVIEGWKWKNCVLFVFLLFCLSSSAQFTKGSFAVTTDIGYNQTKSKFNDGNVVFDKKTKTTTALLNCGYFVRNNFALGITLGLSAGSTAFTNTLNSTKGTTGFNTSSVGIFGRGYKGIAKNKLALFFQGDLLYNSGSSLQNFNGLVNGTIANYRGIDSKTSGFTLAVRPGFMYFLTKNIGLELLVGKIAYRYEEVQKTYSGINLGTDTNSEMNTDFTLSSLMLGINFYFGNPKTQP